jgi:hypothetical protein
MNAIDRAAEGEINKSAALSLRIFLRHFSAVKNPSSRQKKAVEA